MFNMWLSVVWIHLNVIFVSQCVLYSWMQWFSLCGCACVEWLISSRWDKWFFSMAATCVHVNTPAVCEDKAWHYAFLSESLSDLCSPLGLHKHWTCSLEDHFAEALKHFDWLNEATESNVFHQTRVEVLADKYFIHFFILTHTICISEFKLCLGKRYHLCLFWSNIKQVLVFYNLKYLTSNVFISMNPNTYPNEGFWCRQGRLVKPRLINKLFPHRITADNEFEKIGKMSKIQK